MTAHDILRASGLSLDEARADIRAAADERRRAPRADHRRRDRRRRARRRDRRGAPAAPTGPPRLRRHARRHDPRRRGARRRPPRSRARRTARCSSACAPPASTARTCSSAAAPIPRRPARRPTSPGSSSPARSSRSARAPTRFAVGDRVMAIVGGGGQAELCAVHERQAMPVPDAVEPLAGGRAARGLHDRPRRALLAGRPADGRARPDQRRRPAASAPRRSSSPPRPART